MRRTFAALMITGVLVGAMPSLARDAAFSVKSELKGESVDRLVDRAAVQIQLEAIGRIEKMMRHPRAGARKADLTFQLGQACIEAASMYFRIAHEEAHRKNGKVNLAQHRKMMLKGIKTFDAFLKDYPSHDLHPQGLFMRASAYDEIESKKLAERDFLDLVRRFPETPESSPAHMKLAEYATEEKDHAKAVKHLLVIEGRPTDLHFPFALYKLAWAQYNLKNFSTGLDYLRKHIAFYNKRIKEEGSKESSDVAIRENSLKDIAAFYFEGFSKKADDFELANALRSFEKHAVSNPIDPIAVRFTALLRTRAQDVELEEWSVRLMKSDLERTALLGSLAIIFENQVNRRLFTLMSKTMGRVMSIVDKDRKKLLKSDEVTEIKAQLEEGTTYLHKAIVENKKNAKVTELLVPLAGLYHDLIALSPEGDPQIAKAYFNLAETNFDLKQYAKATENYRIIVTKYPRLDKTLAEDRVQLLAIASRFEELKLAKTIPLKLEAKALAKDKADASLDKSYTEWASWIETYKSRFGNKEAILEQYEFESIRVRYAAGRISESIDALYRFLKKKKTLGESDLPSVALVLDTYILSKDWEKLSEISEQLGPRAKMKEIADRLKDLRTDSVIKLAEQDFEKKDLSSALRRAEKCSNTKEDIAEKRSVCDFIQAQVLLEKDGFVKALPALTRVIEKSKDKKMSLAARKLRAQGHFAASDFEKGIIDQLLVIEADGAKGHEERIYRAALMTNNLGIYKNVSSHKTFCETAQKQCRTLKLLVELRSGEGKEVRDINQVQKMDKEMRSLVAIISLPDNMKSFHDTRKFLSEIGDNWSKLDPQVSVQTAPFVMNRVKTAFATMRGQLKHYFRVGEDPATVKLRIDRLKNYEEAADDLSRGMGWKHVHLSLLKDVAIAYQDFASEVPVDEFRSPLLEKAAKLEAEQSKGYQEIATFEKAKIDVAFYRREFRSLGDDEQKFLVSLSSGNLQAASFYLGRYAKVAEFNPIRKEVMEALVLESLGARFEAVEKYKKYVGQKETVVAKQGDSI